MPIEVELLKLRQFLDGLDERIHANLWAVQCGRGGTDFLVTGSIAALCVMKCDCLKAIAALSLKDMRTV